MKIEQAVDVIIPCLNVQAYVERCIKSVSRQTKPVSRIIVVDDGSKDKSATIVKSLQTSIANLELYKQSHRGLSAARNLGLRLSTSPLISFLDIDDYWLPDKIKNQIEYLEKNSKEFPFALSSNVYIEDEFGQLDSLSSVSNKELNARNLLMFRSFIVGSASSVIMPREIIETCGFFDETLTFSEDLDYWIKVSQHFKWKFCSARDVVIVKNMTGLQYQKYLNPKPFQESSKIILDRYSYELNFLEHYFLKSYIEFHVFRISKSFATKNVFSMLRLVVGLIYGVSIRFAKFFS
jgi:glycosyltransferase involved in cell wall biosynthesis